MILTSHPWPLSELTRDEADQILELPPTYRDKRINQLKADIASGAHAKRQRMLSAEAAR